MKWRWESDEMLLLGIKCNFDLINLESVVEMVTDEWCTFHQTVKYQMNGQRRLCSS